MEARALEAERLARAIALDIRGIRCIGLRQPQVATLIGPGQLEAISELIEQGGVDLLIVDAALTAIQQRNLETACKAKVIDRTGLILEIFGERAATAEGRLQIELAHLDYQAGRLVRSWTHLERQRGGYGFLGGPGETQIESDRRIIRKRMVRIRRQLEQSRRTRRLQRRKRQRAPWPVVALVGYTNAGKSTIFNQLTQSSVMAQDMLFATLDPTMREINLLGIGKVIVSDTVGFVSDLPTELIAAFRATLEEVTSADLIVHVRDITHSDTGAQYEDVRRVLDILDVNGGEKQQRKRGRGDSVSSKEKISSQVPHIEFWNKIDCADSYLLEALQEKAKSRSDVVMISGTMGTGLNQAKALIEKTLTAGHVRGEVTLSALKGEAMAWLYAHGRVSTAEHNGLESCLSVALKRSDWQRFHHHWPDVQTIFE